MVGSGVAARRRAFGAALLARGRRAAARRLCSRYGLLGLAARAAPAAALALLWLPGEARAVCAPASPVDNAEVTCIGATVNQNAASGYGGFGDTGNTITVVPGASVTGTANGVVFFSGAVSNSGTIAGNTADGIAAFTATVGNTDTIMGGITGIFANTATVTNSGAISGGTASGIEAATADVSNSGTITGGSNGINATTGTATATVTNSGAISGSTADGIAAGTANVTNFDTITGAIFGIDATAIANVTNSGTISGGTDGIATSTATVTNSGTISGGTADGIEATTATVSNSGSISGGATGRGIQATGTADVTNSGTVSGGFGGITAGTAIVSNSGTISGGAGAAGIFSGTATVSNSGTISGGVTGIVAAGAANVSNSGTIAGGSNGINAGIANVSNSGTISGGTLDGIISSFAANVSNSGTIAGNTNGIRAFGTANVSNSGIVSGNIGIQADAPSTVTTSGAITGTGGAAIMFNAGAGNTLTLAPGFVINGNVVNAALDLTNTLQLGGNGNGTFDVSAIGPAAQYRNFGSVNKVDSSVFTLTGTSSFAGPVNVNGGTLAVNGNAASFGGLSVNSSGTLGGNGTVGNTAINGGTLAPGEPTGNLFGPLTVQGGLSFTAASTYMIQVSMGNAGRTNVTGVATLGGAAVNAVFAPGGNVNRQYTILNAAGGVSGIFNPAATSNNANLQFTLSYDANDAFLNVDLVFVAPNGLNTNQQNVANALSGFFNSSGSIPAVFAALGPGGLTQTSGEAATGSQQTTFNAMNQFMGLLTDPFIAGRGDAVSSSGGAVQFAEENDRANAYMADGKPRATNERDAYAAIHPKAPVAESFAQRWSVWAAGYGGSQTTDGNATLGSNTATSKIYGTAVGADYRFSPFTLAGFALAGGGTNFSIANGLGSGRSDLFQAGVFIRHTVGPAYISAALAYGWQNITTDRTVTIAGIDQLRAKFNANAFSGRVEGGYRMVTQGFGLTPYAASQFTSLELPTYTETAISGANTFALGYAAKNVTATRSELGLRSDKSFAMQNAILILRGRAAWAYDFNADRNIAATYQALPGASFVVNGAAQSHSAALAIASAEMKWLNGFSLAVTFEGEFSNVTKSYAGKGVARYAW